MKKSVKYSLNTIITIALVIGIIIIVMLLSYKYNKRYDLTEEKLFTLSDKTVKVLKGLQSDITVEIFYGRGGNFLAVANSMLDQYKFHTKRITVTALETNQHPVEARENKLTQPDAIVIRGNDRKEVVTRVEEQDITNAILSLTRTGRKTVYFISGHEERDLEGKENENILSVKEDLEKEAYSVSSIKLVSSDKIPDDCDCLVLAGPKTDLLTHEIDLIKNYLKKGGSLMVMLEPWRENSNIVAFLKEKGIIVDNNIVIDRVSKALGGEFYIPVITEYGDHQITKDFRLMTFFPFSRTIDLVEPPPQGISWTILARTSTKAPGSWGEIDKPRRNAKIAYNEGTDKPGPVIIAVAGIESLNMEDSNPAGEKEEKKPDRKRNESRMVVIGNVDFISNQFFPQQGNSNLFLNCITWLTQQDDLISIRPKAAKTVTLFLKEEDKGRIWFFSMILMPGVVVLSGIALNWIKR